jgi:two-component system response regulator YesN
MFRMIIVEDEPPIARNIREKIKAIDPDFKIVGEYENGQDALLEVSIVKPHIILTDIRMPLMDGLSLIEEVKKQDKGILCAILSGFQDFEYARHALRLGTTDYLLKPTNTELLTTFLQSIKNQLMNNQFLVETELLRNWLFTRDADQLQNKNWSYKATEYFYFAYYILIYTWCPSDLNYPLDTLTKLFQQSEWLNDGEHLYPPVSSDPNEYVHLFGVHSLSDERLRKYQELIEHQNINDPVSIVITPISTGLSSLHSVIKSAKKWAKLSNIIEAAAITIVNSETELSEVSRLPIHVEQIHQLIVFLEKQKREEFMKGLELLISSSSFRSSSRLQWIKTVVYLLKTLEYQVESEMIRQQIKQVKEQEIEDIVWQASSQHQMLFGIKEFFGQLFQLEKKEPNKIEAIQNYLHQHYTENITLLDLAETFHLNPYYLSRVFKSEKSLSPLDYLVNVRIEEAKRLIKEYPRLLFKEIGDQIGYKDPYYFSKLFKQWTGQTLTEYKNTLTY